MTDKTEKTAKVEEKAEVSPKLISKASDLFEGQDRTAIKDWLSLSDANKAAWNTMVHTRRAHAVSTVPWAMRPFAWLAMNKWTSPVVSAILITLMSLGGYKMGRSLFGSNEQKTLPAKAK